MIIGIIMSQILRVNIQMVNTLINIILTVLLFLIGFDLGLDVKKIIESIKEVRKEKYLPIFTIISSTLAGIMTTITLNINIKTSLAISLGMGWYSFAGPYITTHINVYYGTIALITNMIREAITYMILPILPKRYKRAGIVIGGATTMDTTLPIIERYGGKKLVGPALYHGILITLLVPMILSALT